MKLADLLFAYRGRIGRAQYWLVVAISIAFFVLVIGAAMTTGSESVVFAAGLAAYAPIVAVAIGAGIRRLNDRNKNPYWLAVFYGLPAVLPFAAALFAGDDGDPENLPLAASMLMYVSFGVTIWALVELGCIRGTIGPNPYGPDPLAPRPAPKPAQH